MAEKQVSSRMIRIGYDEQKSSFAGDVRENAPGYLHSPLEWDKL
jgi:hypothetical protein